MVTKMHFTFYEYAARDGQYERKLTFELENEKETLLKEKRHLSEKENDLSYEQQQLQREVNT